MVECNLRTLSYVSGAVQMLGTTIVAALLITILAMSNDEEFKKEVEASHRTLRFIWYILAADILALCTSIVLFRALKLNNTKMMTYFMYTIELVAGGWTIICFYALIHNTTAYGSFSTAFVQFLSDMIYVFVEVLILIPVALLHRQLQSTRYKPANLRERQGLNDNGPHKLSFQS